MSTAARRILIDDADSAIQYGSGWDAADTTQLNSLGNYGPVYGGTTHATTISGSSLSFQFSGTSVAVFGTINIANKNSVVTPTWTCVVDGTAIPEQNPTFQYPENNWNLCAQSQLSAGEHTLTINVQTTGQAFYFDYLLYTPTDDVDLDGAVLEYMNTDEAVSFQSGWQLWGAQNVTQVNGASVTLNFHGTAVTLLAYVPIELPKNGTSASYTIDGGASTSFTLAGLSQGTTTTVYNVPILQLTGLSAAAHSLAVTYGGDSSYTPLPVGFFHVNNAVLGAAAAPPPNAPTSIMSSSTSLHTSTVTRTFTSGGSVFTTTSVSVSASQTLIAALPSSITNTLAVSANAVGTPESTSSAPGSSSPTFLTEHNATPLGAIVGAAVGGLALLALLVVAIFWRLKRRRRVSNAETPVPFLTSEGGEPVAAYTDSSVGSMEASAAAGSGYADSYTHDQRASPYGFSYPSISNADANTAYTTELSSRRPVVYQQTLDSGVRIPRGSESAQSLLFGQLKPEFVDLPPGYQP